MRFCRQFAANVEDFCNEAFDLDLVELSDLRGRLDVSSGAACRTIGRYFSFDLLSDYEAHGRLVTFGRKNMRYLNLLILSLLALTGPFSALAQDRIEANRTPLFSVYEPLTVAIRAPFKKLFAGARDFNVDGTVYVDTKTIPVRLRARGYFTRGGCHFPKLMLKFKKKEIKGSLFEGNSKVDLNTHCDPKAEFKHFMVKSEEPYREALLYVWAGIINVPSYSTRPARITYIDTDSGETITQWAFFLEHMSSFQQRAQAVEIRHARPTNRMLEPDEEGKVLHRFLGPDQHKELDLVQLARVGVFQNLILNGDSRLSENEIHNLKLLQMPSGAWFPIPMDLNFAAIAMSDNPGGIWNEDHPYFAKIPKERLREILQDVVNKRAELLASLAFLNFNPSTQSVMRIFLENQLNAIQAKIERTK